MGRSGSVRRLGATLLLLSLSGCASTAAREARLEHWSKSGDARFDAQVEGERSPELVVLLAFSGGGTRAAPTEGAEYDFSKLKGKVVLINNVATM